LAEVEVEVENAELWMRLLLNDVKIQLLRDEKWQQADAADRIVIDCVKAF
jgi:hypothetical protein